MVETDQVPLYDQYQLEAIEKLIGSKGGLAWMNVGDGKTRVALATLQELMGDYPVVVIVCRRAAFYDWEQEIATLQLPWAVRPIEDFPLKPTITEKTAILVSEGVLTKNIVQTILYNLYLSGYIGGFIVDEAWLFKNPKTQRSKFLAGYTPCFPTVALSGSVMTARNMLDIYGQAIIAGKGEQVARNVTSFRSEFMIGLQGGGWNTFYPKKGAYAALMERIEPFTYIHMPKIEGQHRHILKVQPTEQQLDYFQQLKETAAVEGILELNSMAAVVIKTQQVSNGWLKGDDDSFIHFPSGKVDRCVALVEEILQSEYKVVVWCAFREDIQRLLPEMEKLSKVATLQGGEDFDTEKWAKMDCRICLAVEASGSSVNHFAQVPYSIYFSQDWKWQHLQQSQGRHQRKSSEHGAAHYFFLFTQKSLDAQVHYTVNHAMRSESSFIKMMDVRAWLKGEGGMTSPKKLQRRK